MDGCWAAFDRLHDELGGGQMKRRTHLSVSNWYADLVRRRWAAVNPADGVDDEFDWSVDSDSSDTRCLESEHVRALDRATNTQTERLLVLALCPWGLRPREVARLHTRQFVRDVPRDTAPYIEFEERRNGPGEVSLLYRHDVLEGHLATNSDAGGRFLFPSPHATRDLISRWTVWNRFGDPAERADLPDETDSVSPTPKLARRFWYDAYASSLNVVLDSLGDVAAEQGSASPEVVLQNYLSATRARNFARSVCASSSLIYSSNATFDCPSRIPPQPLV